jgi:hypothetical protein
MNFALDSTLTQGAMLSLSQKLHDQRQLLLDNNMTEADLFEGTNQHIIANLKRPTSLKEWNDFTSMMLSAQPGILIDSVEEKSMQKQLQLIRNRRIKARPINGSAELYVKVPDSHPQKERLIKIMDDIENSELSIMQVERLED